MKRIKLGIVNSSPYNISYGGVGPFMKNLHPFLDEVFDITYITLPAEVHKYRLVPRRLVFIAFLLFKIRTFKNYDVVLSHVPEGSFIISFTKTPFVHIFHGNHNPMDNSRFWYGKYFKFIFDSFDNRIFKKAKLMFTVGNERANVSKIMNPVYHSIPLKLSENRTGFIFAGRLEKNKNVHKIIKVYSLLDKKIIDDNFLYICGKGSQEGVLKQLVNELDLSQRILFTGELSNDDLIEAVSTKRILLMASLQEGLPMSIAESLSVGTPVISTDTGDISRVIKNNYNGFLLPIEFDFNAYSEKMTLILNNYDFFSMNALQSSDIFKAQNVARLLICDINNLVDANQSKVVEKQNVEVRIESIKTNK